MISTKGGPTRRAVVPRRARRPPRRRGPSAGPPRQARCARDAGLPAAVPSPPAAPRPPRPASPARPAGRRARPAAGRRRAVLTHDETGATSVARAHGRRAGRAAARRPSTAAGRPAGRRKPSPGGADQRCAAGCGGPLRAARRWPCSGRCWPSWSAGWSSRCRRRRGGDHPGGHVHLRRRRATGGHGAPGEREPGQGHPGQGARARAAGRAGRRGPHLLHQPRLRHRRASGAPSTTSSPAASAVARRSPSST